MVWERKDKLIPNSHHHEAHNNEANVSMDSGQTRLRQLGYKQELKRDLSVISNFAFSFSIISVITAITTLYNTGLRYGGPTVMVYGWFVACFFSMFVGLGMAEICSSYPTSGGLYYWLAGPNWAPFASWLTGWFNIVGQWAVTTSVDFSLAQLIQVIILLSTGGNNGGGYLGPVWFVFQKQFSVLQNDKNKKKKKTCLVGLFFETDFIKQFLKQYKIIKRKKIVFYVFILVELKSREANDAPPLKLSLEAPWISASYPTLLLEWLKQVIYYVLMMNTECVSVHLT